MPTLGLGLQLVTVSCLALSILVTALFLSLWMNERQWEYIHTWKLPLIALAQQPPRGSYPTVAASRVTGPLNQ